MAPIQMVPMVNSAPTTPVMTSTEMRQQLITDAFRVAPARPKAAVEEPDAAPKSTEPQ
jgi:hypothetical protein